MLVWAFAVIGAIVGAFQARRRKGNRLDMAQYAAGYGFAFFIVGLIVWIIFMRSST